MVEKSTIRYKFRLFFSLMVQMFIFFVAAENLDIPRAWFLFLVIAIYYLISFLVIYQKKPEIIRARGGRAFRSDTKKWDVPLLLAYSILGTFGQFIVAGWDLGHIHFWPLGLGYLVLGLVLYIVFAVLITWAMIHNPFFEPSVRLQEDRGQKVVKSGPYRIVRHPGYLAGILMHTGIAMVLGSGLALVYCFIIAFLLVVRTYMEDETLQRELDGYREYTQETRFRLIPGVW